MTYLDIVPTIKQTYCPRQYFYMSPEFKETDFFVKYCASVPCRGDICRNRAACWEKLINCGPYVQDENIKISQESTCPSDFYGRLAEYAHDCGATPAQVLAKFRADFYNTEFATHMCPNLSTQCLGKTLKGREWFENKCWPNLLSELKAHQKQK